MRRLSPDRIAVALLTLVVVLSFSDVLFLGYGLARGDLYHYHFPMKRIVRDAMVSGEFPWWNRLYSGGQPMAANPAYEVFYPGQWPILIGTYRFGFNLHIVLHVWIAALGMYALLRAMALAVPAALFGAVSFALSGYFFASLSSLPMCFIWAWTPLALFLLLRLYQSGRALYFSLAALVLAMQFLVAEPLSLALNWVLILCASAWYLRRAGDRRLLRALGILSILMFAAACVAAVQLLPAVDHLRDTSRADGLPYRMIVSRSALPERAAEFVFPHLLGRHRDSGALYWAITRYGTAPYIPSLYLGLMIAVCAAAALRVLPRDALAILAFCAIGYFLALGRHAPLFRLLYDTGIARGFRYPEKFLALIIIPLVVLGAMTLDRILGGDVRARRTAAGIATALAGVSAIVAAFSISSHYARWFLTTWKLGHGAATEAALAVSRRDWLVSAALAAVLALLFGLAHRMPRPLWLAALAFFVIADLQRVSSDISVKMPAELFRPPGVVAAIAPAQNAYALFHAGDWRTDEIDQRFFQTRDQYYWLARNALVPPIAAAWGIRSALEHDYDETYLRPTRDLLDALRKRRQSGERDWWQPLAALSNVRYVADYRGFDEVIRESRGVLSVSRPVTIRQSRADHPRYYLASKLIHVNRSAEFLQALAREPLSGGVAFTALAPAFVPAPGRVLGVRETANSATIDLEASGEAYLVMTVTPHRYWRIAVDGERARTWVTNIGYQGVVIPPGRHRVEMRYRNPLVIAGASLTLTSLIVLALLSWRSARQMGAAR